MGDFKSKAKAATATCTLMENRTKISTDELITKYPDGVTITGFDFLSGDNGKYPVCIFKENSNECFFGGSSLTDICNSWVDGYESTEQCSADLEASGGVKIKFIRSKTKSGRSFIKCEVID